jgi:nickel superoxide dismutase
MIYNVIQRLNKHLEIPHAAAHCDIPCKIYDPISAQIATLSLIRFLDLINELDANTPLTLANQAKLCRLVSEKDAHAAKVKDEINVIWGDYFKQPQFSQFPDIHNLVHRIMLAGSACKQSIDRTSGLALLELVNEFAAAFWATKGIETYTAVCPYPPAEKLIYPQLVNDEQ